MPQYANSELPRLLRDHDAFVFPTLSEGSSVSLLEAMACGLAPVATAVGAAPDLIESGKNGVLTVVEDASAIGEGLRALAQDPARLEAMRREAQATARSFGWEAIGYANVVLEGTRSVPDGFRELAEKQL